MRVRRTVTAPASTREAGPDAGNTPEVSRRSPLLEVRGLKVGYLTETGLAMAVDGVDLTLARGEILGIAGESGSGKSTVAHAVSRLIAPPGLVLGGSVRYYPPIDRSAGLRKSSPVPIDIFSLSPEELRVLRWEEIAIVFQSAMNALNPVLTVEAQIVDAVAAHRSTFSKAEATELATEMLRLVSVPADRVRSYPHELSGGMRQRVAIAMALILKPDLVILDEPTTGLDVVVQRAILERLLALQKQLEFSVIFITHDLSLLLEMCESIMVMYAGRVVEAGSTMSLYRHPLHPYSQGLHDAFPPIVGPRSRLHGIRGLPPDPSNPLTGCPFSPRCDRRFEPCHWILPELFVHDDRQVRCHLYSPTAESRSNSEQPSSTHADVSWAPTVAQAQATEITSSPLLEGRHLTRYFRLQQGRRKIVHAVEDVSLSVEAGNILAIVGESGSGKSTLLRLLALLERPTSGELLLEGNEAPQRRRGAFRYRAKVQLVSQDPYASMNPARTIGYHLGRPLSLHQDSVARGDRGSRISELLERVSLAPASSFVDRYPHELSGGQRQRVMIARALAVGPAVLLADEPVSMLDVSMQVDILNLLADLAISERLGIVYVTHNIASARYLAGTISVMYAGSLVETGPAEELTRCPAHPYTQLLLRSAPHPESRFATSTDVSWPGADSGEPPDPALPASGCRFHPRCPSAEEICRVEVPPPFDVGRGGWATCWLLAPERPVHHSERWVSPVSIAAHGHGGRRSAAPQPNGVPSGGEHDGGESSTVV